MCRGDSLKGLKMKAQLVKRVQEYIKNGRDTMVVDPDPDEIYTKRKARVSNLPNGAAPVTSSVKYPSDGWGQVTHANCSCKAGKVGYCNHVLALMFKACKFSLFDSKSTDDLCQDDDELPDLACTSQLQKWHKKGRGDKISAQPVMEVTVTKTKLDEASYQLTHTEANFVATIDISSVPRNDIGETELTYPRFPLNSGSDFVWPDNLTVSEKALISSLVVAEIKINNIEEATRDQSSSEQWKKERKFRFTASKFDLISKRQRHHEKFAVDLINPKPFTSRYVEHGIKYEPIAIQEYEKVMFTRKTPVKVFKSGFVVCLDMPFLGGSPDGRVVDFGCRISMDSVN
ncbi:unnamed protein product [Porites evermanni]|uniref:SWIM-type domain-containing protein n=1 Tax=Porites evermanni TaxID=104178 RepID=A0ABN8RF54_9CNID|nr:unnamed protein product [Porites evermanni]